MVSHLLVNQAHVLLTDQQSTELVQDAIVKCSRVLGDPLESLDSFLLCFDAHPLKVACTVGRLSVVNVKVPPLHLQAGRPLVGKRIERLHQTLVDLVLAFVEYLAQGFKLVDRVQLHGRLVSRIEDVLQHSDETTSVLERKQLLIALELSLFPLFLSFFLQSETALLFFSGVELVILFTLVRTGDVVKAFLLGLLGRTLPNEKELVKLSFELFHTASKFEGIECNHPREKGLLLLRQMQVVDVFRHLCDFDPLAGCVSH